MKKIFLLLLCLLTVIFTLVSCENEADDLVIVTTAAPVETTAPAETEAQLELPDVKFPGETFDIISRKEVGVYAEFTNFELYAEEYNSDLINDAVYARNLDVEEKYDIEITQFQVSNPATKLQTSVMAEDHAYDVIVAAQDQMSFAATNHILYSLYDVPHIDLSKPWWSRTAEEGFSIANNLYYTISDWLLLDKQRTLMLFFNKQMAADFELGNLYQMVLDGTWTIDKMNEMLVKVSDDLNGNGLVDLDDRFGIVSTSNGVFTSLFFGCENRISTKDEDDFPVLCLYTERSNSTVEKLTAMLRGDLKSSLFPEEWQTRYSGDHWLIPEIIFNSGRALFHGGIAYSAGVSAANAEFDFGIIPNPKYDEAQERYYSIQGIYGSAIGVPIDSVSLDMTGVLLEELAYQSSKKVLPVYYEEWLKVRYTKDSESAQMLDIIFDNVMYDLSYIYNWGGIRDLVGKKIGASTTNIFASTYNANEGKILAAMQKSIDAFIDN